MFLGGEGEEEGEEGCWRDDAENSCGLDAPGEEGSQMPSNGIALICFHWQDLDWENLGDLCTFKLSHFGLCKQTLSCANKEYTCMLSMFGCFT